MSFLHPSSAVAASVAYRDGGSDWRWAAAASAGASAPVLTLPLSAVAATGGGLTRWIHGSWHPATVRVRTGRAFYIMPEYPSAKRRRPEAAAEVAYVLGRLNAMPIRASEKDVNGLVRSGFDLLHFVCHGLADSNDIANAKLELSAVKLGGGGYETGVLTPQVVGQIGRLEGKDGNRPMVVLNACQSGRRGLELTATGGFADAFLDAGAGIFVGTLWSVIDRPARIFVQALYDALLEGKPLSEAATYARTVSAADEPSSWLAYAVYGDPNARLVLEAPQGSR